MAALLLNLVICLLIVMNTHQVHGDQKKVGITYVTNAEEIGAVCNDGSPAAYYYDPGFGDGVDNWLIHLLGGGWCGSDGTCKSRFKGIGSTRNSSRTIFFGQILSANQAVNPDFYNWNRVRVAYCDSSSFMGITDHPGIASRGARIFDAVMEELLQKGMAKATNAILSGSSAGALGAILHCDDFRTLLPCGSRVKCISDSGFFVHATKLYGAEERAKDFKNIATYHGFTNRLPPSCTSRMKASLCMFPQYIIKTLQTPLFLIESKFDDYQLRAKHVSPDRNFSNCAHNLTLCTPSHFQSIKDFGMAVTELLQEIRDYSSSIGIFAHPCHRHGHFFDKSGWDASYTLRNKTIAQAVGDWFYDRDCSFQEIDTDHEFPLTINCKNLSNV